MDITPAVSPDRQKIEGYGSGYFRINGIRHRGSVIVLPSRTLGWGVRDMAGLDTDSLSPVLESEVDLELLLIGCGARPLRLGAALERTLREAGLGVEAMTTGAACRTYNVLIAEERPVAAALMALP